jgi:hypothetical protein
MNHSLSPLPPGFPGAPDHGRFVYGSAGLAASDGLFGNELRNLWLTCAAAADLGAANLPVTQAPSTPAVLIAGSSWGLRRGKNEEKPAKVPTVFEFRKVRFMGPGARSYGFRFVA